MRKKAILVLAMVCVMAAVNFASADTIRGIGMDFVTIGNAGNAVDTGGTPGRGAVSYTYRIGKYEVTNAQWDAFTTAVGAPTGNPSSAYDRGADWTGLQQPTNVSWYETLQFCNYLTSGDKSKGAYQFSGDNANPGDFLGIDRASSISTYGTTYVIPTEDEWYKAAYFKPDGSGYSLYANGTNTAPIAGVQSNYNLATGAPWNINTGTQEQNGTFDMMGNVWEWNEALSGAGSNRGVRGGSFFDYGCYFGYGGIYLISSNRADADPSYDTPYYLNDPVGFRVASVPEPTTLLLLGLGAGILRKKHKKSLRSLRSRR
jgi:formylglycine-generating enzyme required for sulfatase activity